MGGNSRAPLTANPDAFPMTASKTGKMAVDWDLAYDELQGHPRAAGTQARVIVVTPAMR